MTEPRHIGARDNPLLQRLRKLNADPGAYRKLGKVWLEGDHLCSAASARGCIPMQAVITESAWDEPVLRALAEQAPQIALLPDALFKTVSTLESAARIGFLIEAAANSSLLVSAPTVVLDRLQDAGNVGSILRSAAAMGFEQVVALKGTAALWSPKVLRAGMGAHFALNLVEAVEPSALDALELPLLATSSHATQAITQATLPWPCAWVLGHEGQGVQAALLERCAAVLRIPQPGGEESLNAAAAAAICLYESARQR